MKTSSGTWQSGIADEGFWSPIEMLRNMEKIWNEILIYCLYANANIWSNLCKARLAQRYWADCSFANIFWGMYELTNFGSHLKWKMRMAWSRVVSLHVPAMATGGRTCWIIPSEVIPSLAELGILSELRFSFVTVPNGWRLSPMIHIGD